MFSKKGKLAKEVGEALPLLLPTFIKGDKVGRKDLSRRLRRKQGGLALIL